mgnify:CR=1 FL=1
MSKINHFLEACEDNRISEVLSFIDESPDIVFQKNDKGWTGLIVSCFHNHYELAKILVENGAEINATNNKGTSVLMYAKTPVMKDNRCGYDLLSFLLDSGADINHEDNFNKTILDYCMENNAFELSNWLINKGAKNSKLFKNKIK